MGESFQFVSKRMLRFPKNDLKHVFFILFFMRLNQCVNGTNLKNTQDEKRKSTLYSSQLYRTKNVQLKS